ncbi:Hypothetical predicted protein [Mytilus galloprovincialis]|uniref:Short-chain collagen C4-like n=1 Tax=Mytilus galloprovincialis TaxID=29158 RepID=A0A8B6BRN0_MYTGA|nr:Hypothetical predicted protein [Mytilus galloprovincialis]
MVACSDVYMHCVRHLKFAGSVYTRWGRKDCSGNETELVYTGIAGGAWYDYSGSAVITLCLPHNPDVINEDLKKNPFYKDFLYGAEYQDNYFAENLDGNDVPCAVCRAKHSSSILMIPGKTSCSGSWKIEYNGRLASGHYNHHTGSQYVCMDMNPEVLEKGSTDHNGKLFVGVQAKCGSLSCPPFHDNVMVSCVVCSG